MEFLGLDHNSQEEIYNKFTNSSDKENYAFATHNRELLKETQKKHQIKTVGSPSFENLSVVNEDENIDLIEKIVTKYNNYYHGAGGRRSWNEQFKDKKLVESKLFIRKDDVVFGDKVVKSYQEFDSKRKHFEEYRVCGWDSNI